MTYERRVAKLKKQQLWHAGGQEEGVAAGAPLIFCPSAGEHVSKIIKRVCKRFKAEHRIDVRVFERGRTKIGSVVKSDQFNPKTCGRKDCFSCTNGGGGDCSKKKKRKKKIKKIII